MPVIYHRKDYQEDLQGSARYRYLQEKQGRTAGNYVKAGGLICTIPWVLPLLGVIRDIPPYLIYCSVGGGLLLIFSAIMRYGDELRRAFLRCQRCEKQLHPELQESCEFLVCHNCKTFVRGEFRD